MDDKRLIEALQTQARVFMDENYRRPTRTDYLLILKAMIEGANICLKMEITDVR